MMRVVQQRGEKKQTRLKNADYKPGVVAQTFTTRIREAKASGSL